MAEVSLRGPSAAQEKNFVSVFHELCTKFSFGVALYNWEDEQGEGHRKTFQMSLKVKILGIAVLGVGKTKRLAKHDAAREMMLRIRKITRDGGRLKSVPNEKLLSCCEWLEESGILQDEDIPKAPKPPAEPIENASGILKEWLLTRHRSLPDYRVVPSCSFHSKTYLMTCQLNELVTEGDGQSEEAAKHVAAEKMLKILLEEDLY